MELSIKLTGVEELLQKFQPQHVRTAVRRSIIHASKKGKTLMSSQVRERFNIRKTDVDRKIEIKPRLAELQSELILTGQPISLMHFGAREIRGGTLVTGRRIRGEAGYELQRKKTRLGGGGVQVQILKGRRTMLATAMAMGGKKFSAPFIAAGRGGQALVFRREIGSRGQRGEKLAAQRTISYASILKQPQNINRVVQLIRDELNAETTRQLTYALKS